MRYSVIVCTHNRARYVALCGESWRALETPAGVEAELLIVDNNSSDDTAGAAARLIEQVDRRPDWRAAYVFEERQGVAAARNRGVREAQGDWIAFLDDECVAPRAWLTRMHAHIQREQPDMIGGPYRGGFAPDAPEGAYPRGYREEFGDSHHLRDAWPDGPLRKPGLSGGNMAVRRATLERLGGFSEALGMVGSHVAYGEETELQARLLRETDAKIYYARDLELVHLIRPEKTSLGAALHATWRRALAVAERQHAEATADDKDGAWRRLRLLWISLRRGAALTARLALGAARLVVRPAPLATVLHEEIHAGRVQGTLQAAYAALKRR